MILNKEIKIGKVPVLPVYMHLYVALLCLDCVVACLCKIGKVGSDRVSASHTLLDRICCWGKRV